VNTPPRATGNSRFTSALILFEDHWLCAAPGKRWRLALILWSYSVIFGALAIGLSQLAVTLTRALLPELAVRVGVIVTAIIAAGFGGDYALSLLKRGVGW
jgi:hypothetical protein